MPNSDPQPDYYPPSIGKFRVRCDGGVIRGGVKAPDILQTKLVFVLRLGANFFSKRLSDGIQFSNITTPLHCWRRGVD